MKTKFDIIRPLPISPERIKKKPGPKKQLGAYDEQKKIARPKAVYQNESREDHVSRILNTKI